MDERESEYEEAIQRLSFKRPSKPPYPVSHPSPHLSGLARRLDDE